MDYGLFSVPCNLTEAQMDIVETKLMSILGDGVERNLRIPKWILYKDYNFLVWGICCENRLLASRPLEATHKSRPVRGFFAIVISDFKVEELSLPFDINYFRDLYHNEVEKYWDQKVPHQNQTSGFVDGNYKFVSAAHNNYAELLNTNVFQCKSLGELDKDGVVAAALTFEHVSLLIDNDNIEQATNQNGSFMNCLTPFVSFDFHNVDPQYTRTKVSLSSFAQKRAYSDHVETQEVISCKEDKEEPGKDKQIKNELDIAESKITQLELEVKDKSLQIKKKDQWIKILTVVSIILLIALFATQESCSLKLFEREQELLFSPGREYSNGGECRDAGDFSQSSEANFKFMENAINIDAGASEDLLIKFESKLDSIVVRSNVNWIKPLSTSENLMTISVAANEHNGMREGYVIVTSGSLQIDSVVIIQKGK